MPMLPPLTKGPMPMISPRALNASTTTLWRGYTAITASRDAPDPSPMMTAFTRPPGERCHRSSDGHDDYSESNTSPNGGVINADASGTRRLPPKQRRMTEPSHQVSQLANMVSLMEHRRCQSTADATVERRDALRGGLFEIAERYRLQRLV